MTDAEIEELRRAAVSQRDDILIQLGAYVGLRAFKMPQVRPKDIRETEKGKYRLHIRGGKDTTGSGGKPRDAFLPSSVKRDLRQYQNSENIPSRDPFIHLKQRGVRSAVKRTAERTAEETGVEEFRYQAT